MRLRWPFTPLGTLVFGGLAIAGFHILNFGFWWTVKHGGDAMLWALK